MGWRSQRFVWLSTLARWTARAARQPGIAYWQVGGGGVTAQQVGLFDAPVDPLPVRSSDPATSRVAARRLPLRKRKAQVMAAIEWLDAAAVSFTADEVLDVLRHTDSRWERGWVSSRLSQLRRDGLVESCGVAAGRMGSDVMTYRLTGAGREWLAGVS